MKDDQTYSRAAAVVALSAFVGLLLFSTEMHFEFGTLGLAGIVESLIGVTAGGLIAWRIAGAQVRIDHRRTALNSNLRECLTACIELGQPMKRMRNPTNNVIDYNVVADVQSRMLWMIMRATHSGSSEVAAAAEKFQKAFATFEEVLNHPDKPGFKVAQISQGPTTRSAGVFDIAEVVED
jgi:hypothetical protein